jgi:hypothetical protein
MDLPEYGPPCPFQVFRDFIDRIAFHPFNPKDYEGGRVRRIKNISGGRVMFFKKVGPK